MGIVLTYIKDWTVHNVLIHVCHTDKALDAPKLSALLTRMLNERKYPSLLHAMCIRFLPPSSIQFHKVVAVMKDSVSLNPAALNENPGLWAASVKMDCMSHVTSRIGERLHAPWAVPVCSAIAATASHSSNARLSADLSLFCLTRISSRRRGA